MTDSNPILAMNAPKIQAAIEKNRIDAPAPIELSPEEVTKRIADARAAASQQPNPLASGSPQPNSTPNPLLKPEQMTTPVRKTPTIPDLNADPSSLPVVEHAFPGSDDDFTPEVPQEYAISRELPVEPTVSTENTDDPELEALLNEPESPELLKNAPKLENYRRLKSTLKASKEAEKALKTELLEVKTRAEKYEKGELVPEIAAKSIERIAELEKYERIHGLKSSPYYKKEVVEPLDRITDELSAIAQAAKVDVDVVQRAIDTENIVDRNKYLSKNFDILTATRLSALINEAHSIQSKAQELEAEPQKSLQALELSHRAAVDEERQKKKQVIATTSRKSWVDTISKLREEGSAASLIIQKGDPDYIEKHVTPMFEKAATQYGRIVRILAENGLEEMPENLSEALARMVLLAHDSALSTELSKAALNQVEQTSSIAKKYGPLMRPQVGGRSGMPNGQAAVQATAPKSAREVAREHINNIIAKSH